MVEYGSWTEAWENWLEDDLTGCPYVMPLRTTVAADVTAAELFDCFRWFLLATSLGMLRAPSGGGGATAHYPGLLRLTLRAPGYATRSGRAAEPLRAERTGGYGAAIRP